MTGDDLVQKEPVIVYDMMKLFSLILVLLITACHTNRKDDTNAGAGTVSTKPVLKKTAENSNPDTLLISERIDGPANIRDRINGKILFTLNNNIPVTANEPQHQWLQIGLYADLTPEQMSQLLITRGSILLVNGKPVGEAKEHIVLQGAFKSNEGLKGELTGYASVNNIKPGTIPENNFSSIVNSAVADLRISRFRQFLKDYQLSDYDGLLPELKGYEMDENWIDDPSPMLRLWLLFKKDQLVGVFHSRPLQLRLAGSTRVKRGFYFTSFVKDEQLNEKLISRFNAFIVQVD